MVYVVTVVNTRKCNLVGTDSYDRVMMKANNKIFSDNVYLAYTGLYARKKQLQAICIATQLSSHKWETFKQ